MRSNPAQQTPQHQPRGPQLAWRGVPQPPWPGPQPPWSAPARPDTPHDGPATAAANGREAAIGYFGVPILGPLVPLAVYLLRGRTSNYARRHSVQALNLSLTAVLYAICILIVGGVLALDSVNVALVIGIAVAVALWLATLGYAIMAGLSADRGGFRRIPAWLCATIVR